MSDRYYVATFGGAEDVSVSVAQEFWTVQPAANKPIRLAGFRIGQQGTADFGDAQEEGLRFGIYRANATITVTGGTSVTPTLVSATGTACSATVKRTHTTLTTSSTTVDLLDTIPVNVRIPEAQFFIPEFWYEFVNGQCLCIRLITAPNDAISTMNSSIWFVEGG